MTDSDEPSPRTRARLRAGTVASAVPPLRAVSDVLGMLDRAGGAGHPLRPAQQALLDRSDPQDHRQPDRRPDRRVGGHDLRPGDRRHRPLGRLGPGACGNGAGDRAGGLALAVLAGLRRPASRSRESCGLVNGLVSVLWSIPSFIVTLGMLEVARGAAYLVTNSETKYIGPRIEWIARPLAGLGISTAFLIALVLVLLGHVLADSDDLGRYMIAVGTNEEAVRLSGIDPRPVKLITFVLSGLLAGLGALFQVARVSSADPNGANGMELGAIAAVVIGGTSLMGGRGLGPAHVPRRADHRHAPDRAGPGGGVRAGQAA